MPPTTKSPNWGGHREGAGRPKGARGVKKNPPKTKLYVSLSAEQLEAVDRLRREGEKRGDVLRRLLEPHIRK